MTWITIYILYYLHVTKTFRVMHTRNFSDKAIKRKYEIFNVCAHAHVCVCVVSVRVCFKRKRYLYRNVRNFVFSLNYIT